MFSTTPILNGITLLLFIVGCVASKASFAEGSVVERFGVLLQQSESVDHARLKLADEIGDKYVATDIAVYLCEPPSEEICDGSDVAEAWDYFVNGIENDYKASQMARSIHNQFDDESLAYGIAVYWCSPDALDGCEGDPVKGAWDTFFRQIRSDPNPAHAISAISATSADTPLSVAKLIAAAECGESSCYADQLADVDFSELEEFDDDNFDEFEPEAKQQQTPNLQFGFKAKGEVSSTVAAICKTAVNRIAVDMCKGI